ncbi:hypothetical protein EDC04DRAFT_882721 [Pisolithus marmoratus]|nr:hypothetical protein EDC04DRAFT_882721 [Pisolithus marmoratus]
MADYMTRCLGPVLVSLVLSGVLWGCAVVQTYVYYKLFPKDSWRFRALVCYSYTWFSGSSPPRFTNLLISNSFKVALEMCLQTAHLAILVLGVWQTVMSGYDQRSSPWLAITTAISVVFNGPIAFCTQAFFVFRLYTFSQKKALVIFCALLVVTQFVFTLMVSIATVTAGALSLDPWQWFIIFGLFVTICADTTVAVSLSYYLKANEPAFGRTSRVVDRMVLYIMATGMITSISSLASGISILITPDIYTWLGFIIIESGLYTNCLLAALNARC